MVEKSLICLFVIVAVIYLSLSLPKHAKDIVDSCVRLFKRVLYDVPRQLSKGSPHN